MNKQPPYRESLDCFPASINSPTITSPTTVLSNPQTTTKRVMWRSSLRQRINCAKAAKDAADKRETCDNHASDRGHKVLDVLKPATETVATSSNGKQPSCVNPVLVNDVTIHTSHASRVNDCESAPKLQLLNGLNKDESPNSSYTTSNVSCTESNPVFSQSL